MLCEMVSLPVIAGDLAQSRRNSAGMYTQFLLCLHILKGIVSA